MNKTEQLSPLGFEEEESGFQELAKALAEFSKDKIDTERRLPYNIDTGKFSIGDADTVTIDTVWDHPYIIIDKNCSISAVNNRIIDGNITKIDTAMNVYWSATPAEIQENNPFFCKREIDDDENT